MLQEFVFCQTDLGLDLRFNKMFFKDFKAMPNVHYKFRICLLSLFNNFLRISFNFA